MGSAGENLSTEGLNESTSCIGDRLKIGTAIFQVTQPRLPCFKLAAKFADNQIVQTFMDSGRSGLYLSVIQEGIIEAGDGIEIVSRNPAAFSILDAQGLHLPGTLDRKTLERAVRTGALPPGLQKRAEEQLVI